MLSKRSLALFCLAAAAVICALLLTTPSGQAGGNFYVQTNLVSNNGVPGTKVDTNLVNPWGNAFFSGNPFWVNEQGAKVTATTAGFSQIFDGQGTPGPTFPIPRAPGGMPPLGPTGIVANSTNQFGGNFFIFDTLDGTISAWNGGPVTIKVNNNGTKGYTGLAMGNIGAKPFLYAANRGGSIDVFDGNFKPFTTTGKFKDPNLPAGDTPYGIANIDGDIYVAYQSGGLAAVVDDFTTNGVLVRRFATGGPLLAPWAIVIAPANFGVFSNALLVGDFFNGTINAYNLKTQTFLGQLHNTKGQPIFIDGLWSLVVGDGAMGVPPSRSNALYFTAGPQMQTNGLFGYILPVGGPTPTPTKKRPTPTPTKKRPTPTPTKKRPTPTPTKKRATPTPTKKGPTLTPTKRSTPTPTRTCVPPYCY